MKQGLNWVTESKDVGMSPNNLHKNSIVRDSPNDKTVIFYDAEPRNQTLRGQTQGNCAHLHKILFGNRKMQYKLSTF